MAHQRFTVMAEEHWKLQGLAEVLPEHAEMQKRRKATPNCTSEPVLKHCKAAAGMQHCGAPQRTTAEATAKKHCRAACKGGAEEVKNRSTEALGN